jgi:hypothetical protein
MHLERSENWPTRSALSTRALLKRVRLQLDRARARPSCSAAAHRSEGLRDLRASSSGKLIVTPATEYAEYLKGVDTAVFPTTIRRSRTGPGLRLLLRGPLFTLSRADLSPQPPADVRIRRDVVLLHGCRSS